jgi:hypothetical protein
MASMPITTSLAANSSVLAHTTMATAAVMIQTAITTIATRITSGGAQTNYLPTGGSLAKG